ncbi:hypothetical protein, partial [Kitasatospora sp. NPDC002522]
MAAQGKDASIALVACDSAPLAQAVADATGLRVHAPTAEVSTSHIDGSPYEPTTPNLVVHVRKEDGAYGEYLTFHPNEPLPETGGETVMDPRAFTVRFPERSKWPYVVWEEDIREAARGITPELIRRHLAGLEQPVITITGRGNGRFTANRTGVERAETVRALLAAEIEAQASRAGVVLDLGQIIEVASAGRSALPADLLPNVDAADRQRSVTVELAFPEQAPPVPTARVREIPSGMWVTDRALPPRAQVQFRQALDALSARGDAFVVAMHVGAKGTPVTEHQLGQLLIDAYDAGKLDGRTTVDFLSCRSGAEDTGSVAYALSMLWAHQEANPRAALPDSIPGRAPVGDVWVVPNGDGGNDVVVADQVGLRSDGTPVVFQSGTSKWRTFSDSGDAAHTPRHADSEGGHLAADGTIDDELPAGFTAGRADGLRAHDGAVKFGPGPESPAEGSGARARDDGAGEESVQSQVTGGHTDPAFTPAKAVDPAASRQSPRRIADTQRLSAGDQVVGLHKDAGQVVEEITRLFGETVGGPARASAESIIRSYVDAQTLRPMLSALSRGDGWAVPFDGEGWSG